MRKSEYALDTNILIYLSDYVVNPVKLKQEIKIEDYYAIKYLDKIIKEDLEKGKDAEISLLFSDTVTRELLKWINDGKEGIVMKYTRSNCIEPFIVLGKNTLTYDKIFRILMGKDFQNHPDYYPLFSDNDTWDCRIMAECGLENRPLITQNKKHFMGENGCIRKEIEGRLQENSKFISKWNGKGCENCTIYSISEFIEKIFPEQYIEMQREIVNETKMDMGKVD